MAPWYPSLETKRAACWTLGIQHREALVSQHMEVRGLRARPFLKDVLDDLIGECQGARLVEGPLPLDTYAQTESEDGRVLVTINSRIPEMDGVKDVAGVVFVTKCHESIHIPAVTPAADEAGQLQGAFPGFVAQVPRLIVCRRSGAIGHVEAGQPSVRELRFGQPPPGVRRVDPVEAEREFMAENAGLAMAIAGPDLVRCPSFLEFRNRAMVGGDLGSAGWRLLYQTAESIGVNTSALVRYFGYRGLVQVVEDSERRRLVAAPQLFEAVEYL